MDDLIERTSWRMEQLALFLFITDEFIYCINCWQSPEAGFAFAGCMAD
ncbi:hypothetical protein [Bacillus sp. FJAT-44742]|nr:hypothetical protein [Bacillus sp. FJAT-44742]